MKNLARGNVNFWEKDWHNTLLRLLPVLIALVFGLFIVACNKSKGPEAEQNSATQAAPAQAGSAPAAPAQAAPAPAEPTPTFSAAQKIGAFVYPKNSQPHDQQLRDELDCYNSVQQQTGFNPETPPPSGPSSADIQAAQQQAADQADQAKGGRVRGAAKGAAGGAMIGAIAGDAGKGAAIGAVGGTVVGGTRQRKANAQSKEQAAQGASAQMQQQAQQATAAYNQKQSTFKRGFSACMDARGYSVQ